MGAGRRRIHGRTPSPELKDEGCPRMSEKKGGPQRLKEVCMLLAHLLEAGHMTPAEGRDLPCTF